MVDTLSNKQLQLISDIFATGVPVVLAGGYAEEAWLNGKVTEQHHDIDMLTATQDFQVLQTNLENLGCSVEVVRLPGIDRVYKLFIRRGDVAGDVVLMDQDLSNKTLSADIFTREGKKVRIAIDENEILGQQPPSLEGIQVKAASPRALMQMRNAQSLVFTPREKDARQQEALRLKFFPQETLDSKVFLPQIIDLHTS